MGLGSSLVGRSHECDFPSFVSKLPVCTHALIDSHKKSSEINTDVQLLLKQGLSLYKVQWDVLRQCHPDYILTQSQCQACAVSLTDVQKGIETELGFAVNVVDFHPHRLAEVWKNFEDLGQVLGVAQQAQKKLNNMTQHIEAIFKKIVNVSDKPSVAAIEWIDPLMMAGHWMPELISLAGGVCAFGETGTPSDWVSWEALRAANPDIIIVAACGFDMDRARAEMGPLTIREGWYDLAAVQNNRVFLCDGHQFFNRPGPRLVESLEILAEIIHPDLFDFGHKIENWQYWGFNRVI